MWQLAVDLGAAETVATLARDGAPAQIMDIEGTPAMPSGVYAEPDGRLLVGLDAQRRAEHDPSRYERYPVLRIPETNLLLGGRVVPVVDALAAVLGRVAGEVRQRLGAEANQILLSTPAYWSALETQVLQQAATAVWGYGAAQLVPGAHAAGAYYAVQSAMPLGYPFAVYDLGAGGLSCAVLVAAPEAVRVLAMAGAAGVGGVAADAAVIEYLGRQVSGRDPAAWQATVRPSDLAGRRAGLALQRTAQQAREQLSTLTQVSLELLPPFGPVPLTRGELQGVLGGQLELTVGVLHGALAEARLVPGQLAGVFLLGGLARMPMVSELIGSRFRLLGGPFGEYQDAAVPFGAPLTVLAPPSEVSAPAPAAAVLPVPTWQPHTADDLALPVGQPVPHAAASRGSKTALAVAAGVAVLVVLLVAGVAVVALNAGSAKTETIAAPTTESGTTEPATPAPSRSRRSAPTTVPPRSTAPRTPTSVVPPPPVVTGWQTVAVPSRGAAYDVPPEWRVASQDTIGGFEPKSGAPVVGKGYATFGDKFCDKYDAKAVTAVTNSTDPDPAAGALELATKWATVAFSNDATGTVPPLQIGLPQAVQTTSGATGTLVQVSAPVDKKQACSVPAASMYALTLPSSASGSVALMIYVARGVPDEVSAPVIQQIVGSVRPL